MTAGRWPWKSEPAKDRVTTHLPNGHELKMDGAETRNLYSAGGKSAFCCRVGGRAGDCEVRGVSQHEISRGADLGCSSNYTREIRVD